MITDYTHLIIIFGMNFLNKNNKKTFIVNNFILLFVLYSVPFFLLATPFNISAPLVSQQAPKLEAIIVEAYKALNIEVNIIRMPAKRALAESSKNTWVDAELARVADAEKYLPNFIKIPVPLMAMKVSAYSLNTYVDISSWQSLQSFNVVTVRGLVGISSKLM